MKLYFIETESSNISTHYSHFLVKANNKKEAINKVFKQYFEWQNTPELKERGYAYYTKKELICTEVEKLFKEKQLGETYECVCLR